MKQKYSIHAFFNQLKESKSQSISFFIKGITPADQGLEFLKENISDLSEYNFRIMNPNSVLISQNSENNMAVIKLEEKEDGFKYTLIDSYHNEELLKFILEERNVTNYEITNIRCGNNNKGQDTLFVNIPNDRFLYLSEELSNMGYSLRSRL